MKSSQLTMFKTTTTTQMNSSKVYIGVDPGIDGAICALRGSDVIDRVIVPCYEKTTNKPSRTRKNKDGSGGEIKKDKFNKTIYIKSRVIDDQKYCDAIKSLKVKYPDASVTIEKVRNIMGTSAMTNFNFGHNFGLIRGFLISVFGADNIKEVPPKTWQSKVQISSDLALDPKTNSKDPKATALKSVMRLFPNEVLKASVRSSVPHDGLVDALLIAKYAQLTDTSVQEDVYVDEF